MITYFLVALLSMEPAPTFMWLGGFDTLKDCQTFIEKKIKPADRARMDCWGVVKGRTVEA